MVADKGAAGRHQGQPGDQWPEGAALAGHGQAVLGRGDQAAEVDVAHEAGRQLVGQGVVRPAGGLGQMPGPSRPGDLPGESAGEGEVGRPALGWEGGGAQPLGRGKPAGRLGDGQRVASGALNQPGHHRIRQAVSQQPGGLAGRQAGQGQQW